MSSHCNAIVIFLRYPEPGKVKSRLAASISPGEASIVYEKLVRRTLGVVGEVKRTRPDTEIFLFFTPAENDLQVRNAFPGPWDFVPQVGSHLGERMDRAVRHVMSAQPCRVVLAGTDLADMQPRDFLDAFDALDAGYVALGPAHDGGFYLIGLDRPCPFAFQPESWGTPDVFSRTRSLLIKSGFSVRTLHTRRDMDRPEDLPLLHTMPIFRSRLSVIIPTLRPVDLLLPVIQSLEPQLWPGDEIVIVRAGGDPTPFAASDKTRCTTSPRGRGRQLNRGAQIARGEVFLFLHDDCSPPPNFVFHAHGILEFPSPALGHFLLSFTPSSPALDLIAKWANLRSRFFHLPYGDQGLICTRETFFKLGGFQKDYLMEDVDLVSRCMRDGRLVCIPHAIEASPQSYLTGGILRTSLRNHFLMLLYHMGVHDRKLYSIYYANSSKASRDFQEA